ncbi:hypothetical protein KR074_010925 [Drosophila pseudoananassae]|nr:hypothetical protein KR074_010925 [Drosophila pseudoananassae]
MNNYPGKLFVTNLKLVGRERFINGTIEILKDLDNKYQVSVEVSSDASGAGYKQSPLEVAPMPICSALQSFYQRFIKKSIVTGINTDVDFKNGKLCPIPKGMHFLKNVYFDKSDWVVIMPRGLLKVRLSIMDKIEFAGGFEYILEIKDKAI